MAENATFKDRIARIEARAARGDAAGCVTPGVVDDSTAHIAAPKARRVRRDSASSLGTVMGGLFATASIVAVTAAILVGNANVGGFDGRALSLFSDAE